MKKDYHICGRPGETFINDTNISDCADCNIRSIEALRVEIETLKDKLHRRNLLCNARAKEIAELKKQLETFKEFARSEIVCDCGKQLWLTNFINNPLNR